MSSETILYRIEPDGSCSAYGIEAWGGQPLEAPPGDPFHYRYIDGEWVPIPVEELPTPVVSLEQQVADLQQTVTDQIQTEVTQQIVDVQETVTQQITDLKTLITDLQHQISLLSAKVKN